MATCATGYQQWCNEKAILMPNIFFFFLQEHFLSIGGEKMGV
jgi:hypothetical protein